MLPALDSIEEQQAKDELTFALLDGHYENMERGILKFMVGRGYWPLGTKVEVTPDFKCKATFPARRA